MMWWDSTTFANHADPGQLSRYFAEAQRIGAHPRTGGIDAVTAAGTR